MAVATPVEPAAPVYPVRLWMEYPERLSRLSTFFRLLLAIPVFIFVALLSGGSVDAQQWDPDQTQNTGVAASSVIGGVLLAIWITILLRRNIPRWLFDFYVAVQRFSYRALAYFALLIDKYPAFEGNWYLQYWVDYPERPSRWKVLFWKLITSIPHFFILIFLSIAAAIVVFIAWFAILFTAKFPRGMHDFVVGVLRWYARVHAYFASLTDAFPPFSLDHDAGPGSKSAETISAIIGGIVLALFVAGAAAAAIVLFLYLGREKSTDVAYADVTDGGIESRIELDDVTFTLTSAEDPASTDLLAAGAGNRLVSFAVRYEGEDPDPAFVGPGNLKVRDIESDTLRLETDDDSSVKPVLLTFDREAAPLEVDENASGEIIAIFEIGADDQPEELRAYPNDGIDRHVAWKFE
jgi:hypothetical protein